MYLYTCPPCLEGHHERCHGTQYPPKGQFGGSKCDCICKAVKPEPAFAISTCNTCGYSWNTLVSGLHNCESIMIERIKELEQSKQRLVAELLESNRLLKADAAQIQQLGNEIARLNGQTNFLCQCGGVKPAPASIPTPTPKAMENIIRDFLKSNGWTSAASTLPDGTRQGVYKSPTTGRYYSMVYALLSALDKHRTA